LSTLKQTILVQLRSSRMPFPLDRFRINDWKTTQHSFRYRTDGRYEIGFPKLENKGTDGTMDW